MNLAVSIQTGAQISFCAASCYCYGFSESLHSVAGVTGIPHKALVFSEDRMAAHFMTPKT